MKILLKTLVIILITILVCTKCDNSSDSGEASQLSSDTSIMSTLGVVDNTALTIKGLPFDTTLDQLEASITPAAGASFETYETDCITIAADLMTGYKIVVTAQDSTNAVYTIIINEALDTTPPEWLTTYPLAGTIGSSSFEIKVKLNESSNLYFIVVADGSASPTASQVKAGISYNGVIIIINGSDSVIANTEKTITISGLSSSNSYDIYIIAEDENNNIQTGNSKIDITTAVDLMDDSYTYTVIFDDQDATTLVDPNNMTVTGPDEYLDALPVEPVKTGYVFSGWWTGTGGTGTQFLLSTKVTSSMTLYAYWEEISDSSNWDMEDFSSNPPPGFNILTDAITMTQEFMSVHGGSSSAKITWTSTNNQDIQTKYKSPVIAGTSYSSSVWIYDNDVSGRARLGMFFYDSTNTFLSSSWATTYSSDSTNWQQLTWSCAAPTNTVTAIIAVRFYDVGSSFPGTATVYIDDLTFAAE